MNLTMCVLIGSARPNPNGYIRASGIWPKSNKPDFGPHKLKILVARIWIYIIIYSNNNWGKRIWKNKIGGKEEMVWRECYLLVSSLTCNPLSSFLTNHSHFLHYFTFLPYFPPYRTKLRYHINYRVIVKNRSIEMEVESLIGFVIETPDVSAHNYNMCLSYHHDNW